MNQITPQLFERYKTCRDYADSPIHELEEYIRPTGFYKNKAKHIKQTCQILIERFHSQVPNRMEDLLLLPGIARKTANIVLSEGFGLSEGIAVDTHVKRLSQRLGLTDHQDPNKIESDLMKIIPSAYWREVTLLLINHGRNICKARKPLCTDCVINEICPSAFTV